MNLEKLIGLKEVLQEQLVKYATEHLGLDKSYAGHSPEITELSCVCITGMGNLSYVISEDDDVDAVMEVLGIIDDPYSHVKCEAFDKLPNHMTMDVLEKAGYKVINVYPSKAEGFIDVLYQRPEKSKPYVYAVVSKYVC